MAKIKTHYLNWDREDGSSLTLYFLTGHTVEMPHLAITKEHFRTREFDLDETLAPSDVYEMFNSDDRPDGETERSMCVGDLIEYENGDIWAVQVFGFKRYA